MIATPTTMPYTDLGIASLSLGSFRYHSFPAKLAAAAKAGFTSIEIFDLDWKRWRDHYARTQGTPRSAYDGDAASLAAAKALGDLARSYGMRISNWQPLRSFEGWLDADDRERARGQAAGILSLLPHLGTDLLLVCTTTAGAPHTTGDLDACAEDMAWLADEAAKYNPPIRVMYEGLSFGAHRRSWQDAYEVVDKANRPNLGICLDSFNMLAYEWADPYAEDGRKSADVDDQLTKNLAELVQRVPKDKIYFVQLADAQRMDPPMTPPEDPEVPLLRPWSRSHRLFPLEKELGGYLPVLPFCEAILRTGYAGPWSLEVFNDSLDDVDASVPETHAARGFKALNKILDMAGAKA